MKKSSYRNFFSSQREWSYNCRMHSNNLNVTFARTAKLESFRAKWFWIHTTQCPITALNSSGDQKTKIDKANRAGSENILIKAFSNMINFWFFTPAVKKRNSNVSYETALGAVSDALSNDTNPAQNGWVGAEIWLMYWKMWSLKIAKNGVSGQSCFQFFGTLRVLWSRCFYTKRCAISRSTIITKVYSRLWKDSQAIEPRRMMSDHESWRFLWYSDYLDMIGGTKRTIKYKVL